MVAREKKFPAPGNSLSARTIAPGSRPAERLALLYPEGELF